MFFVSKIRPLRSIFLQINIFYYMNIFNYFKELKKEFNLPDKIFTSYNLVNIVHRVDIAMNGFNTYNRLRKQKDWAYWIDYSQIRLGYGVDVYYGTPMGME